MYIVYRFERVLERRVNHGKLENNKSAKVREHVNTCECKGRIRMLCFFCMVYRVLILLGNTDHSVDSSRRWIGKATHKKVTIESTVL